MSTRLLSWNVSNGHVEIGRKLHVAADLQNLMAGGNLDERAIYRSTDGGTTWSRLTSTNPAFQQASANQYSTGLSWNNGNVILVPSYNAPAARSDDGGATWKAVAQVPGNGHLLGSADGSLLMTYGYPWSGPYYASRDGGETWSVALSAHWGGAGGMSANGRVCVIACNSEGVHLSTDGARSFRCVDAVGNGAWQSVWVSADGNVIWLVDPGARRSFFISRDGGANWEQRPMPEGRYVGWISGSSDGSVMLASEVNGCELLVSDDGGQTWTPQGVGARNTRWLTLSVSNDGTRFLAAGPIVGVYPGTSLLCAKPGPVVHVNSLPTGVVEVTGDAAIGCRLWIRQSLADRDILGTFSFAWERAAQTSGPWSSIEGASSESYTLTDADLFLCVRAVVSYTDGAGTNETVASSPTSPVVVNTLAISGDARVDQVLQSNLWPNTNDRVGRTTIRWQRALTSTGPWEDVVGGNGTAFIAKPGDEGRYLRVVVEYISGQEKRYEIASTPTTAIRQSATVTWKATEFRNRWRSYGLSGFDDGSTLVVGSSAGVAISTDAGNTWSFSQVCAPNGAAQYCRTAVGSERWFAAIRDGHVYFSENKGQTWTPCFRNWTEYGGGDGTRNWHALACSANGQVVVAAAWNTGGCFISNDGRGLNPRLVADSGEARSWIAAACSSDGSRQVLLHHGGRIYTSSDYGQNWTARDTNRNWTGVASSTSGMILVASAAEGLFTSHDGGMTWIDRQRGGGFTYVAVNHAGQVMIAAIDKGPLLVSIDSGTTWVKQENLTAMWSGLRVSANGRVFAASNSDGAVLVGRLRSITGSPRIDGEVAERQTLFARNDIQDPEGIHSAISYVWYRLSEPGGTAEQVGTGDSYTLTSNDIGRYIQVCALYSNGRGEHEKVWSSCTRSVANVNDAPTGAIVIQGMVTEGQTLRAQNQLLDADGLGQLEYVWQQAASAVGPWTDIPDATGETHVVRTVDIGRVLRVKVSYTDARGTREEVCSAATTWVMNVNELPTGSVVLSGIPWVGEELKATNTLADTDGLGAISYSWQNAAAVEGPWMDILNATGNSYLLASSDLGKFVRVKATYVDLRGTRETVYSSPTSTNVVEATRAEWRPEPACPVAGNLLVQSQDGLTLCVVGANKLFGTADRGSSWTSSSFDGDSNVEAFAGNALGNRLIRARRNAPLYVTDNAGQTWTARETERAWSCVASSGDGSRLAAAVWQGQIFTSTDWGNTWTARADARAWNALAVADNMETLVAVEHSGRIHVSSDSGATWTAREQARPWQCVAVSGNGNVMLAAAMGGLLYVSTDKGQTWRPCERSRNWIAVAISYQARILMAAVQNGGIFISNDLGQTWAEQSIPSSDWSSVAVSNNGTRLAAVSKSAGLFLGQLERAPTGIVNVAGTVKEGQTISASNTLSDPNGMGPITYTWERGQTQQGPWIHITRGHEYLIEDADVNAYLRVKAHYTNGSGNLVMVCSSPTQAVENMNQAATGTVSITGDPCFGATLVASNSLADQDGMGTVTYTWERAYVENQFYPTIVEGATYTVDEPDAGSYLRVCATYKDARGTIETKRSASTAKVAGPRGSVTVTPTSNLKDGDVLRFDAGITDEDGVDFIRFELERARGNEPFVSANRGIRFQSGTEQLTAEDIGYRWRCRASYQTRTGVLRSKCSVPTEIVGQWNGGTVEISGSPKEGQTLTASLSTPAIQTTDVEYAWQRRDNENDPWLPISGATAQSYTVQPADSGRLIRATIAFRRKYDNGGAANYRSECSSSALRILHINHLATGQLILKRADGSAFVDLGSDPLREGTSLTVDGLQSVQDADGFFLSEVRVTWQRLAFNGSWEDVGHGPAWTLLRADVGLQIRAVVSFTDHWGAEERLISPNSGRIHPYPHPVQGSLRLEGEAKEDNTLSVKNDLEDPNRQGPFSYTWWRAPTVDGLWTRILGAFGEKYTLTEDDVFQHIRVKTSYSDIIGEEKERSSNPTAQVANINDQPRGSLYLAGSYTKGEHLLVIDAVTDEDGRSEFTQYKWQRGTAPVGDPRNEIVWEDIADNQARYDITENDEWQMLRVVMIYTDKHGTREEVVSKALPWEYPGDWQNRAYVLSLDNGSGRVLTLDAATEQVKPWPLMLYGARNPGQEWRLYAGGECNTFRICNRWNGKTLGVDPNGQVVCNETFNDHATLWRLVWTNNQTLYLLHVEKKYLLSLSQGTNASTVGDEPMALSIVDAAALHAESKSSPLLEPREMLETVSRRLPDDITEPATDWTAPLPNDVPALEEPPKQLATPFQVNVLGLSVQMPLQFVGKIEFLEADEEEQQEEEQQEEGEEEQNNADEEEENEEEDEEEDFLWRARGEVLLYWPFSCVARDFVALVKMPELEEAEEGEEGESTEGEDKKDEQKGDSLKLPWRIEFKLPPGKIPESYANVGAELRGKSFGPWLGLVLDMMQPFVDVFQDPHIILANYEDETEVDGLASPYDQEPEDIEFGPGFTAVQVVPFWRLPPLVYLKAPLETLKIALPDVPPVLVTMGVAMEESDPKYSLKAKMDLEPSLELIPSFLTLKGIELGAEFGKEERKFEMEVDFDVRVPARSEPLPMAGTIAYEVEKDGPSVTMGLALEEGTKWENPLGIPGVDLADLGFSLTVAKGTVTGFGFTGSLGVPHLLKGQYAKLSTSFKLDKPDQMLFSVTFPKINLVEVVTALLGRAAGANVNLSFRQVTLYVCSEDVEIGGKKYEKGIRFAGAFDWFGYQGFGKVKYEDMSYLGVEGQLDEIKVQVGGLCLFGLKASKNAPLLEGKQGPLVNVEVDKNKAMAQVRLSAAVTIFGESWGDAFMDVTPLGTFNVALTQSVSFLGTTIVRTLKLENVSPVSGRLRGQVGFSQTCTVGLSMTILGATISLPIGGVLVDVSAGLAATSVSIGVTANFKLGNVSITAAFTLPGWLTDAEFYAELVKEIAKKAYGVLADAMEWLKNQLVKLGHILKDVAQDIAKFWKGVAKSLGRTAEQLEAEVKKIADAVASTCNVAATAMVTALADTGEQAAKILTNLYGQSFDTVKQLLSGRFPDHEINDAIRSLPGGDEFINGLEAGWNAFTGAFKR